MTSAEVRRHAAIRRSRARPDCGSALAARVRVAVRVAPAGLAAVGSGPVLVLLPAV
jgi:hypothetical protein